jgi:hypothetical protein
VAFSSVFLCFWSRLAPPGRPPVHPSVGKFHEWSNKILWLKNLINAEFDLNFPQTRFVMIIREIVKHYPRASCVLTTSGRLSRAISDLPRLFRENSSIEPDHPMRQRFTRLPSKSPELSPAHSMERDGRGRYIGETVFAHVVT